MPVYTYTELPSEGPTTRMIRLLPQKEKKTHIDCELFTYDLSDTAGRKHRYEALSYVWGSEVKTHSIRLNNCVFPVTENLHAALSQLRDGNFERILWVDAICINQADDDEKAHQIQIMRSIYGQAQCVIVWLGEAVNDGDKALDSIRQLAEHNELEARPGSAQTLGTSDDFCWPLLQRDWFRRIWVLQEVGLARCVCIVCGPVEVNGHAFCEGLSRLPLPASAWERIRPVIHLIRGAIFRPQYQLHSRGAYSIGQLMDMYRFHDASVPHDKVYALLGLCSDEPNAPGLKPNYRVLWHEVFAQVITYILSRDCTVETWPERDTAVIKGQGCILGQIEGVQDGSSNNGQQRIDVFFTKAGQVMGYESEWGPCWVVQASPVSIQKGDILVLLQGAAMPSIIRVCRDHFTIIMIAAKPLRRKDWGNQEPENPPGARLLEHPLHHLVLTWEWAPSRPGNDSRRDLSEKVVEYREERSNEASRKYDITPAIEEIALEILKLKDSPSSAMEGLLLQIASHIPITENVVKAVAGITAGYAPDIMDSFFKYRRESLSISEEVVKEAVGNTGRYALEMFKLLLRYRGDRLSISEKVTKAAVANIGPDAPRIVELLLQNQQDLRISEAVVKAAAESRGEHGLEIVELLFQYRGADIPISEDIVEAAVSNEEGEYGPRLLEILFQHFGDRLPVPESVIIAAAGNTGYYVQKIFELLFQHLGDNLPMSESTVKAILGLDAYYGPRIMRVILQHRQDSLTISEDMIKVVAGNQRYGSKMMEFFLKAQGDSLPISEAVLMAVVENTGHVPHEIMDVLLRYRGDRLLIPEGVVQSLLQSPGYYATKILDVIFQHRGQSLPVSEELVKTAVGNTGPVGHKVADVLLRHRGKDLSISEAVVKAAAGNTGRNGPSIIELLFQYRGESLPVTEAIMQAAAENTGYNKGKIMDALLRHRGESVPISEDVVKATVMNPSWNSIHNMEILLQHRGDRLPISEEIIKTAVGREADWGLGILHTMFEHRGGNLPISEEVVKFVIESESLYAPNMMKLFLMHLGDRLPITKALIKAADSRAYASDFVNLFLQYRGESIRPLLKSTVTNPLARLTLGLGMFGVVSDPS
ncbi:heterokaryon incompatibility protein-domain-containing protein [Aspergillus floccosus]